MYQMPSPAAHAFSVFFAAASIHTVPTKSFEHLANTHAVHAVASSPWPPPVKAWAFQSL